MPFARSFPDNAGPANVFAAEPDIYRSWSEMSQALMNAPSPLSPGERELILAYAAGVAGCAFVYVTHSEVAYARGLEHGLLDQLLDDLDAAPVSPRLKVLPRFVRRLMVSPG